MCIILLFSYGIRAGGLVSLGLVCVVRRRPVAGGGCRSQVFQRLMSEVSQCASCSPNLSSVHCIFIVVHRLLLPSASGHLPAAVQLSSSLSKATHSLFFFLTIQQCEPLFSISVPLSAAFRRHCPPALVAAVRGCPPPSATIRYCSQLPTAVKHSPKLPAATVY